MPSQLKQILSLYMLHAQRCLWSCRLPLARLTGCSVVCSPGKFQTSLAALWQREWREELNLSCAVLLSFSIALRECILQRSYLVLLVGQTEVFNHSNTLHMMINERKLTFRSLQSPLKDRWRNCADTWHYPLICSSSSRSTETLLLHCCRGWW